MANILRSYMQCNALSNKYKFFQSLVSKQMFNFMIFLKNVGQNDVIDMLSYLMMHIFIILLRVSIIFE